ncbi:N-methyl-L-tryptophan oxidase [Microscilla marina]|uniref:Monomeric sarcosine oxidase n=1 Tax=Microscilla marina ATCC 23134 TaxID=313606 RepID=A1ZFQ9_MICM2|nr:N-methyl-L-tryptophan oxidase [Microscilla marina]EAY30833.1 monomeric sarcosine oxidase [Microscilla marina ATCC 23134]
MQDTLYDAIVIGVGAMGAAATYYLANQGAQVLALEQYDIVHPHGSHFGQSRLIRKAYAEHPDYVPLLERAYTNWTSLEQATQQKLYHEVGLAYLGTPEAQFIKDVKASAQQYDIPLETYLSEVAQKRFPQFKLLPNQEAVWEPNAGYITPERTLTVLTQAAQQQGADIRTREIVFNWQLKEGKVKVSTNQGTYFAHKLIVTAGAYTAKILPQLADDLQVTRQLMAWIKPKKAIDNMPCWIVDLPEVPGIYYGFPWLPPEWLATEANQTVGFKLGHHTPGQAVLPKDLPLTENKELIAQEKANLQAFIAQHLPDLQGDFVEVKHCLYTYSPDEHFIIDYLPETHQKVVIAAGFSGHGFKFVPAIGEILADLALKGSTNLPIGFLSLSRLQQ